MSLKKDGADDEDAISHAAHRPDQGAARAAIMGRPVRSVTSLMEDLAAVSVADVHEVGREAFASSLFALPPKNQPYRPRVTQLGGSSGAVVAGRRIRSTDYPLDQARLVIGEEGVSLVRGRAVDTVRYAQCAALLKWPDGARQLISRDAVTIRIEPTLWRMKNHGAQLDDMVTADRSAFLPIRPDETVPRPWTRRQTRMAGRMLVNPSMAFLTGTVPVAALVALVATFAPAAWGLAAVVLAVPGLGLGASAARSVRARLLTRAAGRNAQRR